MHCFHYLIKHLYERTKINIAIDFRILVRNFLRVSRLVRENFCTESDPIDLIIGDYDMYVSLYVSYYTVGQSLSVTDTVDMRINKIASDAAELISDVVNTTATIKGTTLTLKTSTEIMSFENGNGYLEFSYRNIIFASNVLQFTSDIQGEMTGSGITLPLAGIMTVRAVRKAASNKGR